MFKPHQEKVAKEMRRQWPILPPSSWPTRGSESRLNASVHGVRAKRPVRRQFGVVALVNQLAYGTCELSSHR